MHSLGAHTPAPNRPPRRWLQPAPLHREMAYSGGALYASGGLLLLLTLVVPGWEQQSTGWVAAVAAVAVTVGTFFVWAADHLPIPLLLYVLATGFGAVLITVAVFAGGPDATAGYGVLYVFVAAYGFYYYPGPIAIAEVVVVGVGFALALAWHATAAAPAEWIMVVGSAVIAGGLIGSLGQRVRTLLAAEQATVATLSQLDEWKTTFLRAVAHDLRSPLIALVGLVSTLDGPAQGEAQRAAVRDHAVASGQRLLRLVDDLLDLERIQAGELRPRLEPTALDRLVRDCVDTVAMDRSTVELDVEPVTLPVEAAKVERIVVNLVANARQHTPPRTRIWVRLHADGAGAVLRVEDDGPGLPAAVREHLFQPFRAGGGRDDPHGVGLGLHLVQRFTELHGGTLAVGDRPGGGTRVEVRLPGADPSVTPADLIR